MKASYLALFFLLGIFSQNGWAPPPGKGGAPDISKCDINPSKQTKVKLKDKSGNEHFICTGQAFCGGKATPVSCKISEREPCPTAVKCLVFPKSDPSDRQALMTLLIKKYKIKFGKDLSRESTEALIFQFPEIISWPKTSENENHILGILKSWGDCRDLWYSSRINCLKMGNPESVCGPAYDDCVKHCDGNFLTIEKLFIN